MSADSSSEVCKERDESATADFNFRNPIVRSGPSVWAGISEFLRILAGRHDESNGILNPDVFSRENRPSFAYFVSASVILLKFLLFSISRHSQQTLVCADQRWALSSDLTRGPAIC